MSLLTSKLLEIFPAINLNLNSSLPTAFTFSRASQGTQVQSGVLSYAPNNVVRNSTMVGAVAGSPGTLPTNWSINNQAGLTSSVVGTGNLAGIPYIDIRLSGTASGALFLALFTDSATFAVASPGQTWTSSNYLAIVGGTTANISGMSMIANGRTSVGGNAEGTLPTSFIAASASLSRYVSSGTFSAVTVAYVVGVMNLNFGAAAVDITLRIGAPQLEIGPTATAYNPTTTAVYYGPRFETSPAGYLNEPQATNLNPNNSTTGAVVGTPGTLPTGVGVATPAGLTTNVVAIGTSSGIPYYDIRVFGTSTGANYELNLVTSGVTLTASIPYTNSLYSSVVGGTTSNIISLYSYITGTGALYRADLNTSGTLTRTSGTSTTTATTGGSLFLRITPTGAVAIDITIRIAGSQFEQSAFPTSLIQTTTAAATRAADNLTLDLTQLPGLQTAGGYSCALEFSLLSNSQSNTTVMGASINGDYNNSWYLQTTGTGLMLTTVVAGVAVGSAQIAFRTAGMTNRLALSITPAGIRWTMNGAAVIAATNAGQPLMGTLAVGRLASAANFYTAMHATLVTLTPGPQSDAALIARAY